jgi:hypothetical protein
MVRVFGIIGYTYEIIFYPKKLTNLNDVIFLNLWTSGHRTLDISPQHVKRRKHVVL